MLQYFTKVIEMVVMLLMLLLYCLGHRFLKVYEKSLQE